MNETLFCAACCTPRGEREIPFDDIESTVLCSEKIEAKEKQ